MSDYTTLRNILDEYRWIDLVDLSIYSQGKLRGALKKHQEVLEDFDISISDIDALKIKEICYERLVKLSVLLQGEPDALTLSEEELRVIKAVTRPSWLDDPASLQKYIKGNLQCDIKTPSEIIKRELERCKRDSEIVGRMHNKVRPFVRSYLVTTCEHRREALEESQKLYENEFAVKVEQIKSSLRAVIRDLEAKINNRREQLRRLDKIRDFSSFRTVEAELEKLKCETQDQTTKLYISRILHSASKVKSGSGDMNECFEMYRSLHEHSLEEWGLLHKKLKAYLMRLDDVKAVLLEISRFSEEERVRLDVSLVTKTAATCVHEFQGVLDAAYKTTAERFSLSTPSTEDAEEAFRSFRITTSEIRKRKGEDVEETKKSLEIEREDEEYESEEMPSITPDNL
jgi:hypothetical protein